MIVWHRFATAIEKLVEGLSLLFDISSTLRQRERHPRTGFVRR